MNLTANWDGFLRNFLPFIWSRRIQARKDAEVAAHAVRIARVNKMGLDELLAAGFMSDKDSRMIREIQAAVQADDTTKNGLGNYALHPGDPLTIRATFPGGKPHCWPGYHQFNLRHWEDQAEFETELYRKIARSLVFHATVENPAPIYKSTKDSFFPGDFDPELTLLKIFDRYEGHYSNG